MDTIKRFLDNDDPRCIANRCLRSNDAAHVLGVAPGTLANWRGCGRGPRYVRLGRRVVYRIEDLEAYLDEHTVAGDEEAKHSKPLCDAPSPSMSWDATRCAPGGGIHGCSQ